ncbi:uncharacterized protein METZ01_LOCUS276920 [marine metagenome]|uniref:Uncharacterized protein n=1 Tax=marine metagenome TaxID=408172 RepID=A0A382KIU4_9ZZZZ
MTTQTTIEITEDVTDVSVTGDTITLDITDDVTTVQAYTLAIPISAPGTLNASNIITTPYNTITATDLDTALKQLADQDFRGDDTPSGDYIEQGDLWYESDTETLKIYREVSSNVYDWIPIAMSTGDSDTLDGGSY